LCENAANCVPICPTLALSLTNVAYSKYTIIKRKITDNIFFAILKPLFDLF